MNACICCMWVSSNKVIWLAIVSPSVLWFNHFNARKRWAKHFHSISFVEVEWNISSNFATKQRSLGNHGHGTIFKWLPIQCSPLKRPSRFIGHFSQSPNDMEYIAIKFAWINGRKTRLNGRFSTKIGEKNRIFRNFLQNYIAKNIYSWFRLIEPLWDRS